MTAPSFTPGKPGYERVKRCLSGREELVADFILTWDNSGGKEYLVSSRCRI
jgi:hypothetical protein